MPRLLLAFLLSLFAVGCASPLDAARLSLGASTALYNASNASATARKASARDACLAPPTPPAESPACVEKVIDRWAVRAAAIEVLRAAILDAEAVLALLAALDASRMPLDAAMLARLETAVRATLAAGAAVLDAKESP